MIGLGSTLPPPDLSPARRLENLAGLANGVLDVLVVGGGITGSGVALDAASRGLSVGLIEARDFGAGTSSRSSKLIHGGLRYLEQLHFGLVREALRERALLFEKLAPHLVRPVSFMFPLRRRYIDRVYIGSGLLFYDLLAGTSPGARARFPRHEHLGRAGALALAPSLRREDLRGAIRYFDAEVDDARLVLEVVRTAAAHGAKVANRVRAVRFLKVGEQVCGVVARDEEADREFDLRAERVICAGGVWTEELEREAGVQGGLAVRASKGVHLVIDKEHLPLETGLIARTEKSVLLVIPWGRHWIVGTTDTEWTSKRFAPVVNSNDIDYLLAHLNAELSIRITRAEVVATFAGLRPLLRGRASSTAELGREHAVAQPIRGLTFVAGGKYTTYRVMATDVLDLALSDLGTKAPPSRTENVPMVGVVAASGQSARLTEIARRSRVRPETLDHLLGRYGGLVEEVLEVVARDPEMGQPIPGAGDYLLAEARYAASNEGALHIDDVLERRTRIAFEYRDRGAAAAEAVGAAMAPVLDWTPSLLNEEVVRYRGRVSAAQAGELVPSDEAALAEMAVADSRYD